MLNLVLLVGIITSAQEVKVKGGALINKVGNANLINQIVIIKKNYTGINDMRARAIEIENCLNNLKRSERDEDNKDLIEGMSQKLSDITGTRSKRSLLPFVGTALNRLFGVATESDLERERERLNKIERWANNLGNIIQGTVSVLNNHAKLINNITSALNVLSNKLEDTINNLERKLIYQDMALKIDEIVNDVRFKMEALLEAKFNRVSVNLISIKELEEVISYSVIKFLMKPLEIDIVSYYNLMSVKVVHDQVYVLIPFDDDKNIKIYEIIPFPMNVKGNPIILDNEIEIILEKDRMDLITLRKKKEFEGSCVEIKANDYICNFELFYTENIHNFKCVNFLLNDGEDDCTYKMPENDLKIHLLKDNLYVYTKDKENLVMNCEGKENRLIIENIHVFPRGCYMKIINKLYYEPTLFKEVKVNEHVKNYDFKINVSHINLPRVNQMAESMNYVNFLFEYKEKVLPVMSLVYFPLMVLIGVVVVVLFRKIIMNKINKIHKILKEKKENSE